MVETIKVNPQSLSRELELPTEKVEATIALLEVGYPAPFIIRYRKDLTNLENASDVARIAAAYEKQRKFADRKYSYLKTLEKLEKLTPDLLNRVVECRSPHRLEDVYLPFKSKRDEAAQRARALGLDALADKILDPENDSATLEELAAPFVAPEKGVASAKDALDGAVAVIRERYVETFELRQTARGFVLHNGRFVSKRVERDADEKNDATSANVDSTESVAPATSTTESATTEPTPNEPAQEKSRKRGKTDADPKLDSRVAQFERQFASYLDASFEIRNLTRDRVQILDRGEALKAIVVSFDVDRERLKEIARETLVNRERPRAEFLDKIAEDAVINVLLPTLELEIKTDLVERAIEQSFGDVARSLRNKLLQRPLVGRRALAVDCGARGAGKIAALDQFGNPLAVESINLRDDGRRAAAADKIADFIEKHNLTVFALRAPSNRNRGSLDAFFANLIEERFADRDVAYVEVSDLGVDAYAASPAAAADFPFWPSSARAAFAIGRRLLNPLEEYLKVPPALLCDDGFCNRKMNAKAIKDAVAKVEVRCVNEVGVELNRASFDVLRCICGLNPLSAQNIVERRKTLGAFRNREELKTVAGISDAAFELCAGFLKIVGGDEPLDATWIHPESYDLARKILGKLGFATEDLAREDKRALIAESVEKINLEELAKEFDAGPKLVADILAEFVNPGADARDKRPGPAFKRAPIKIESLAVGTKLVGVVTSVAEFGAFVDVGASILGLVHISELSARARDARQIVSVGDPMTVWVRSVDIKGSRLSLTAVSPDAPRDKPRAIRNDKKARDGERPDRSQDRRKPRDAENAVANRDSRDGERTRRPRREGDSENAAKRDRPPRRNDRNRDDRDRPPRSAQVAPKEKEATPLSEEKKSGKESLQSFSELKQFFGL